MEAAEDFSFFQGNYPQFRSNVEPSVGLREPDLGSVPQNLRIHHTIPIQTSSDEYFDTFGSTSANKPSEIPSLRSDISVIEDEELIFGVPKKFVVITKLFKNQEVF